DIEAWIHRPIEVRRAEIGTEKQQGKIKRPLNGFMLYRKAYQNRVKALWKHPSQPIISQVCGKSWNLEPELIRGRFNAWAKIERDNHEKAHPGYKFTPAKPK
ncbi:high mobility group box domain-containing protein, partial [Diplogelasinospora grovesii]